MTATPPIVDRDSWQEQLDALRVREKAHTREGDAIAAARRGLPMVEMDPGTPLVGANGTVSLLDTFEGRGQLFASYHMWHTGLPAADQCEGCTFNTGQALELSYLHSRDVTFAVFCQGPYAESSRYREFMGWDMPWYSVPEESHERLAVQTPSWHDFGMRACYLRSPAPPLARSSPGRQTTLNPAGRPRRPVSASSRSGPSPRCAAETAASAAASSTA